MQKRIVKKTIHSFDIVIRINLPPNKKYYNTIKRCDILFCYVQVVHIMY